MEPKNNVNASSDQNEATPTKASIHSQEAPFEERVLMAKVAQICDQVGYHAITRDSANILVDIYRRTIIHLARHCKEAANNNRRVEPTFVDLIQAYDFVGISIPELKDHIENVKLPFNIKIDEGEREPSNRIQRDLPVDDLLEAEKNTQLEDVNDDVGEKAMSDSGIEEEEKPPVPLLKDVYHDISQQFPGPCTPTKADKTKIKREEKPAIPRLKITPLDPSIAEPPSFLPLLENIKQEHPVPGVNVASGAHKSPSPSVLTTTPVKTSKKKTKILTKSKLKNKTKTKTKSKTKLKTKLKAKPNVKTKVATHTSSAPTLPSPHPDPVPPTPPPAEVVVKLPTPAPNPTPPPPPVVAAPSVAKASISSPKQTKNKKKKKKSTNSQFAIVTETVNADDGDKEWLCPTCGKPDDGDVMLACDTCEEWYHIKCTNLKKPPKDDENWDCSNCMSRKQQQQQQHEQKQSSSKGSRKRSHTPVEVPVKTKTPELVTVKIEAPPPPPVPVNPDKPAATTSQDDLCPECHLPDDGTLMIQCDDPFCAKWFHGKCVNVLEEPTETDSWFCNVCVDKQQSAFKRRRRAK